MKAAIVGLGITGAALGIFLRRLGIEVEIFEQAPQLGPIGAGILLQPSGQKVLETLGVLQHVSSDAEAVEEVFIRTSSGKQLLKLRFDEFFENKRAFGVHRGKLFTELHRELLTLGATIKLGTRICRIQSEPEVTLQDSRERQYAGFDFIVACDGSASTLHQSAGLAARDFVYQHGALWYIGQTSKVQGQLLQVTQGSRRLCGLLPTGQGQCSLFWGAKKSEVESIRADLSRWKHHALKLFPEASEILEQVKDPKDLLFTQWRHRALTSPIKGRILFMGDSAFASSPHLGQGVNLGLVDALAFSRALEKSGDFESAARNFFRARSRQRKFYAQLSYLLSPFFQSDLPLLGTLRDYGLPLMLHIKPIRAQMISVLSGTRRGWFDFDLKAREDETILS